MSWLRFLRTGDIGEITASVSTNSAQSARKAIPGWQGAEHAEHNVTGLLIVPNDWLEWITQKIAAGIGRNTAVRFLEKISGYGGISVKRTATIFMQTGCVFQLLHSLFIASGRALLFRREQVASPVPAQHAIDLVNDRFRDSN